MPSSPYSALELRARDLALHLLRAENDRLHRLEARPGGNSIVAVGCKQVIKVSVGWQPNLASQRRLENYISSTGMLIPEYLGDGIRDGITFQMYKAVDGCESDFVEELPRVSLALRDIHLLRPTHFPETHVGHPRRRRRYAEALSMLMEDGLVGDRKLRCWTADLFEAAREDWHSPGQVPIHGDFRPENTLVTDRHLWILDWADAHLGSIEEELGQMAPHVALAVLAESQKSQTSGLEPTRLDYNDVSRLLVSGHSLAKTLALHHYDIFTSDEVRGNIAHWWSVLEED